MRYFPLIFASALATAGCSYHYDIVAVEQFGAIVFEPAKDTGSGCFVEFSVKDQKGNVMWEVASGKYLPPPCDSKFPITYGATPQGMTERVKPVPLQTGITYRAEGWDGDNYSGAFRLRRGVIVDNMTEQR